ncbi:formylglycine-generating enzyme family protein [Sedimentitalea sp.]|uniref:formylglycine-generating enzyme family protein n=1 Tax=Sedimentitalea sp. TaxID=2048915 RepID=UPI0032976DA3
MQTDNPPQVKGCCAPSRPVGTASQLKNASQAGISGNTDSSDRVEIPGAIALIGTDTPVIAVDGEGPLRHKRIASFSMDTATVTNRRFASFVEATGYLTDAERLGNSLVFEGLLPSDAPPSRAVAAVPWWRLIDGACWRNPVGQTGTGPMRLDDPVTQVSWNDATAFSEWAGGRLPSEAEWEHAARGGLGDVRFPWGDRNPDDITFLPCNIWQGKFPQHNTGADGFLGLSPAKSFAPNDYGLFNMAGNVWEWTCDPFKVRSLKKDVIAHHKGKNGYKLSKGGSFLCHASYCFRYRIAARTGTSPDTGTSHQGFRVVYQSQKSR